MTPATLNPKPPPDLRAHWADVAETLAIAYLSDAGPVFMGLVSASSPQFNRFPPEHPGNFSGAVEHASTLHTGCVVNTAQHRKPIPSSNSAIFSESPPSCEYHDTILRRDFHASTLNNSYLRVRERMFSSAAARTQP